MQSFIKSRRRHPKPRVSICVKNAGPRLWLVSLALVAFVLQPLPAKIVIDMVDVGDPGNPAQSPENTNSGPRSGDGLGSVPYRYRIATNPTTLNEYTAFLNAVAATDPYGLFNPSMATNGNIAGIQRNGSPGNYSYEVLGNGNRPVTYVSWFDAARFANWLHNGQPVGSQTENVTETGAYTLMGATTGTTITLNPGARFWIPSEDEWYKAAYYDPTKNDGAGGYWLYATRSNSLAGNNPAVPGSANFRSGSYATTPGNNFYSASQNYLTEAGAYGPHSQSYYGTNDQTGNVQEWTDEVANSYSRYVRGGAWHQTDGVNLRSTGRLTQTVSALGENSSLGFRVASIPEPGVAIITCLCLMSGMLRRRRGS